MHVQTRYSFERKLRIGIFAFWLVVDVNHPLRPLPITTKFIFIRSLSVAVAVLMHSSYSYGDLVRQPFDCLLQQFLPSSAQRGVMTAVRIRLALVFVVVARWSMNQNVIFIISVFVVLP